MSFKTLHEFTVTIEKEVTEITTREENGQKITTEGKVKKDVPHTVILKEPTRRERQELALFQSIRYNEAINKGLLPKIVMQQKIGKDAENPLSEEEDKNLTEMNRRLQELANDYIAITQNKDLPVTEDVKERKEKLLTEYMVLSKKVIDINTAYQSVYAYTAENYMQTKTLAWLHLYLTFVKDTPDAAPRPLFPGSDYDAKEQSLADLEDSENPLYFKALEKLPTYWMLYFFGRAGKSEEFVAFDENEAKRVAAEEKMQEEANKAKEASVKPVESKPETDAADPVLV